MKLSRLALAVALLPASTLYAADKNEEALKLSETVITANRIAEERQDSAAAVTVFTREDIQAMKDVRAAFNPHGLCNIDKLVPETVPLPGSQSAFDASAI